MSEVKIKKCKSTHGKYNLDNGNVIIQVDVELDTKEITKNIALKVEELVMATPELLHALEWVSSVKRSEFLEQPEFWMGRCISVAEEAINKAKGKN